MQVSWSLCRLFAFLSLKPYVLPGATWRVRSELSPAVPNVTTLNSALSWRSIVCLLLSQFPLSADDTARPERNAANRQRLQVTLHTLTFVNQKHAAARDDVPKRQMLGRTRWRTTMLLIVVAAVVKAVAVLSWSQQINQLQRPHKLNEIYSDEW